MLNKTPAEMSASPRLLSGLMVAILMAAGTPAAIMIPMGVVHAQEMSWRDRPNGFMDETAEERARRERIEQLEREIAPVVREANTTIANYRFPRRVEQTDLNRYQDTLAKISELRSLQQGEDGYYRGYADASRVREAMSIMRFQMEENPVSDAIDKNGAIKYVFSALTTGAIAQVAGELAKQTQADRSSAESIATYALQEALKNDAVELSEKLTPIDSACTNLTSGDQITTISGTPGHYALVANKQFIEKLDSRYGNARATILASNAQGVKEYCSAFDARMGRCSTSSVSFPGGDMMATTLLGSEGSGEGTSETYVSGQIEAADAYINRVIPPRLLPGPLPVKCDTPQCKAYEELRAQALARTLAARSSLATLAGRRTSVVDMPASDGVATQEKGLASSPEN